MRKLPFRISPILVIAIVALAVALGSLSVQLLREDAAGTSELAIEGLPQEFQKLSEVWEALQKDHLEGGSLDPGTLSAGAIRGMLDALDDPYASYLDPRQYSIESQDFRGAFSGIGAQVTIRDGQITIVAPIPDTPADAAGMRPGDIILEIDGVSTEGYSLLDAVTQIRGPEGEPVELVVQRATTGETATLTIIRDIVQIKSVSIRMLVGGIAHVRITTFTETTARELAEALDQVKEFEAKGLILDVRNNPGGILSSVVNTTSQFIKDGLVLYEIDGQGNRRDWRVKSGGKATDIPLVLLINEFSASGSEVLAGAVMDNGRGTVLGVKTFGKGSVNTLRNLSDGSGIYFTIARWYTPKGTLIEGQGLEPNIEVLNPEDGSEDIQLDRAIEILEEAFKA